MQIPKLDGSSLCQQLRSQGYHKPILLLTAKDSNDDIVAGLDAGADDYVNSGRFRLYSCGFNRQVQDVSL
ncbi:MAG: response regulator [Coleofasciculus sp. S288]|nr:response regulator [Coleofasciculus sp. S288]